MRGHRIGVCGRLLPGVIFCQGEQLGLPLSLHANATGSDVPLAYSFSLLVAGTASCKKPPVQLPSTDKLSAPRNYSMHLTPEPSPKS
jgi:hypothetical protein